MYAAGAGSMPEIIGGPNQRVVQNPDPYNPVISGADEASDSTSFMRLMIEQLKYQDPLNPLKSNEFTTQLAQMNSLEQLITLNQMMNRFYSSQRLADCTALIGQYVEGLDANNEFVTGYVDRVELIEGEPTLKLDDKLLLLEQVMLVDDTPPETGGDAS